MSVEWQLTILFSAALFAVALVGSALILVSVEPQPTPLAVPSCR